MNARTIGALGCARNDRYAVQNAVVFASAVEVVGRGAGAGRGMSALLTAAVASMSAPAAPNASTQLRGATSVTSTDEPTIMATRNAATRTPEQRAWCLRSSA